MTLIRRSTPLVDLVSFQDAMERLFDERFSRPTWIGSGERPEDRGSQADTRQAPGFPRAR